MSPYSYPSSNGYYTDCPAGQDYDNCVAKRRTADYVGTFIIVGCVLVILGLVACCNRAMKRRAAALTTLAPSNAALCEPPPPPYAPPPSNGQLTSGTGCSVVMISATPITVQEVHQPYPAVQSYGFSSFSPKVEDSSKLQLRPVGLERSASVPGPSCAPGYALGPGSINSSLGLRRSVSTLPPYKKTA